MTSFHIKIIAIITMVIDHVGLFFFPEHPILRDIGRLAFPLFAWLIANGAYHTHDIQKYMKRLLVLAVVSQVPFTIANQHIGSPLFYLNVVFTLVLGLLSIYILKNNRNVLLSSVLVLACAGIANLIHSDYGAAGVLSIVAFYIFYNNKKAMVFSQVIIMSILPAMTLILMSIKKIDLSSYYLSSFTETYGLLSLALIFFYNNKVGYKMKYLFYIFYPLQYISIAIFQIVLNN